MSAKWLGRDNPEASRTSTQQAVAPEADTVTEFPRARQSRLFFLPHTREYQWVAEICPAYGIGESNLCGTEYRDVDADAVAETIVDNNRKRLYFEHDDVAMSRDVFCCQFWHVMVSCFNCICCSIFLPDTVSPALSSSYDVFASCFECWLAFLLSSTWIHVVSSSSRSPKASLCTEHALPPFLKQAIICRCICHLSRSSLMKVHPHALLFDQRNSWIINKIQRQTGVNIGCLLFYIPAI